MSSRYPSWIVAAVGVIIVIIATATGSLTLHTLWKEIGVIQSDIAKAHRELDRLWSSHHDADQREATADVFFGQALGNAEAAMERAILLRQVATYSRDAVFSILAASGISVHEQARAELRKHGVEIRTGDFINTHDALPEEFRKLVYEIQTGDFINAYSFLKIKINELRLFSRTYLKSERLE